MLEAVEDGLVVVLEVEKGIVEGAVVAQAVDLGLVELLEGLHRFPQPADTELVCGPGPAEELHRLVEPLDCRLAPGRHGGDGLAEAVHAVEEVEETGDGGGPGGEAEEVALEGLHKGEDAEEEEGQGDGAVDAGVEGLCGNGLRLERRHYLGERIQGVAADGEVGIHTGEACVHLGGGTENADSDLKVSRAREWK